MKSKDKAQLSLFESVNEASPIEKEKYHYLFVVSPSNEIKEKVRQAKEQLKKIVPQASLALHSTPHISVMGFQTGKKLDESTFDAISRLLQKTPRFAIAFKGFQNFLHGQISNTLYISIENENPLLELNKILVNFFGLTQRHFKPHMTVAKTLPRESLEAIKDFINNEKFEEKFLCTGITVLESISKENKMSAYNVCKTISLRDSK